MAKLNNKKIAIIGGGIGGLVVGYELIKKGYEVTVFEKEKEIGGLLADFKIEGENLEKVYHHIFKTDKEVIDLIEELGLQNKLKWHKSSIGLYYDGKMYPFLGAIDLLKFRGLGLIDKFRLGLVYLWLKFDGAWKKYENITAAEWMEKWAGKKAYEVIWKPLLKGKFHEYYQKVSMAWLWARIHTRGGSTNEKGEEVLGYLDDGFIQIINKLKEKVKIINKEIVNIKELEKKFDLVIDTRPIKNIDYIGAVDLVFSSNQSLSEYYWHNINDLKSPFLVMVQHNNLLKNGGYNGKNIYYLGTYVPQDHEYFKISDEKIEREWFDYLKKIKPEFDEKQVLEKKIFKFKNAQHIVGRKYKVPSYKVGEKTYRLNFAQIYPEDRGINFAVKEARKLVKMIEKDLTGR
ncbi:MAG: FAD-dependent oxidoreductase [Candidatus Shapirobacteria bacterium]|nr:FAD-dependent oxidoreductase [Candidatus Shapirobacteria bacterium]MDD3002553.1 FAD-dependent oxidoreductase [Candidatus Shapirobacteria bacterium]MDD4383078.1 FAD-dependent oxidoreductase [Candidatus Shapirobacteria bacterium]